MSRCDISADLTIVGAPSVIELDNTENRELIASGQLWKKMLKWQNNGGLMGCAMIDNVAGQGDTGLGILRNHAYGILDLQEIGNGTKLLR